jgi:hypothetical protein
MTPYPNLRDLEQLAGIAWGDLAAMEPGLEELLWHARQACADCHDWSDVDRLFGPLRNGLAELVGFAGRNHRHPILGGSGAYQVAYWKLYDAVAGLLPRRAGAEQSTEQQRAEKRTDSRTPVAAAA